MSKDRSGHKSNWIVTIPLVLLAFIFSQVIFLLDLNVPMGIAIGCTYSIIILFSWVFTSDSASIYTGIYCTILILIGFVLSPRNTEEIQIGSINRIISIIVVWICTGLVYIAKKNFKSLEETNSKLEETVLQRTKEIENRNKELEQFVYITSHDLQEPLRTIRSFIDIFNNDYTNKLDENGLKYLNFINQSAIRMSVLLKGVLDYSRLGRAKKNGLVDLQSIINDLKSDVNTTYALNEVIIKGENLPQVFGNEVELKILFQNLFTNAIKFKRPDSYVEIIITVQRELKQWLFCFSDNGIGIEKEYHDKIFGIFQRLHLKSEFEGAGIGLSLCQKVVELHGGKIWVNSQKNIGSNFYFTLPITA